MKTQLSRRSFMKATVLAASPLIVPRLSMAAPPSGKLQHAAIGVGGQGAYDLGQIVSSNKVEVIALCDIDAVTLEKAAQLHPGARLYRDWREMLEAEERNIDSVNVSTPDHTHAPAAMTAIRKGKHVFCEKPLTHDIHEARRLTKAARRYDVATQMGIQIHSHDAYRTAVHWLRQGAIGKVKEWHSWASASYTRENKGRPEGSDPIPPHVEWDLWLGVAPERPYKKDLYHPFNWRCWRDFGGGATGDFGCHIFDPVFTALEITNPLTVRVTPECVSDEVWPAWVVSEYVFEGTEWTADRVIHATWRDGGKQPPKSVSADFPDRYEFPSSGSVLIGEEGTMVIPHVAAPRLYPVEKFKDYPKPEFESLNHYHQFVEASMGNGVAGANFDFAGPLTEAVLLTNVANRFPGETLEWNARWCKFNNHREANKFVERDYRDGWEVRGL